MKLVTWNTRWCCGLDGQVSPERIVKQARSLADFDVLCLQEVCINYPELTGCPSHDQPAVLRALLPGFQIFFGAAVHEWGRSGEQSFGNLVATRLPVLQVQHHALPYPSEPGTSSMPRMCTVVTVADPRLGAVRVMTAHLEFYARRQRAEQVRALVDLHLQACDHAASPPQPIDDGSPFQARVHTQQAVLCGDFNLTASEADYAAICQTSRHGAFWDCWKLVHGDQPQPPTFRVFDKTYGPEPVACDFVFASESLKDRVRHIAIDGQTRASDHQPMVVDIH